MAITMELYELKNICKEMAALGAATIVQSNAPSKDLVSQRNGAAPNSKRFYSMVELQSLNNAETLKTIINR